MKGHIRQRGKRGTWYAVIDDPAEGARKRRWHRLEAKNRKEADAALRTLLKSVDDHAYVGPNKLTVGEYLLGKIDQWETAKKISVRTAERYRELAKNQIIPHLGSERIQKLDVEAIENWHATLISTGRKDGKGLSPTTVGHAHRLLSKALKQAKRLKIVNANVAREIEALPKNDKDELQIIDEASIRELPAKLAGRSIYPQAIVSLFTGLRRGEVLALRWRHVDLDRKIIKVEQSLEQTKKHGIRFKAPKSKAGRREITMPAIVADALREHKRKQLELRFSLGLGKLGDDDLLFADVNGAPMSPQGLSVTWIKVAGEIGMPDVTFHALRHSHASMLIAAGVPITEIAKRLGHSTPVITLRTYAHVFKDKDSAAAAIDNALAEWPR